jgi:hypothetical protein
MTTALPEITPALLDCIARHRDADVDDLLLRIALPAGIPRAFVAAQVEARRRLRRKLPGWVAEDAVLYPSRLATEQASSSHTAAWKADAVRAFISRRAQRAGDRLPPAFADLTSGMGVDALAFARTGMFERATSCERDATLAALLRHNAAVLGVGDAGCSLDVREGDGIAWLQSQPDDSLLLAYLDPARRDDRGGRVVAFADCAPDAAASMPLLLRKASVVLVKASPMLDIDLACRQLGPVAEVHVVASDGECKELLFIACRDAPAVPTIVAAEGREDAPWQRFEFTRAEEHAAVAEHGAPARYVYEPGAALMKAGAFRLLAQRFGLRKLHANTHLYTSDVLVPGFPGRCFEVEAMAACSAKGARALFPGRTAMLLARNAGMPTDALRTRLGLRDGGELFAIAATCAEGGRLLLRARRCVGD